MQQASGGHVLGAYWYERLTIDRASKGAHGSDPIAFETFYEFAFETFETAHAIHDRSKVLDLVPQDEVNIILIDVTCTGTVLFNRSVHIPQYFKS